ncbi:hypothetical protein LIA77_07132 [Sarocladium implicatum]|nr:hypothetical protein LIA77_07132 [Sarocladium implicatum]
MLRFTILVTLMAGLLAQVAVADLVVKNWCKQQVTIKVSKEGGCDTGPDGCTRDGNEPWRLKHGKKPSIWRHKWNGSAVSVKIGKKGKKGILQYEYSNDAGGHWWNISDLDGKGGGLVGSPFRGNHVGVTVSGKGAGVGNCTNIRCPPHKVCHDSYQDPYEEKTRWCPRDTGDMTLDLCMPKKYFGDGRVH